MKRPIIPAILFFIYGIIVEQYLPQSIVLFLVVGIIASFFIYLFTKWIPSCVYILFFILGIITMQNANYKESHMAINLPFSQDAIIEGVIVDKYISNNNEKENNWSRYVIKSGKTKILIISDENDLTIGDKIKANGKIEKLQKQRNYGGFNEEQYYKTKGITGKVFATNIKKTGLENSLNTFLKNKRDSAEIILDKVFLPKESGIMKAMLLGDKTFLDDDTKEIYKLAGIYHMLAISGTHISIIGLIILYVLKKVFNENRHIAGVTTFILLIAFCMFTGNSVSTIRAVLMISLVLIGDIIYRNSDIIASLSFAAFAILIFQPLYLFEIGFQLSFTAVLSIGLLTKPIEKLFDNIQWRFYYFRVIINNVYLKKYLSTVLAIFIGQFAISTYYFHYIFNYSILVNLIVVPSLFIVIIFGLLSILFGGISVIIGKIIGMVVVLFLKLYEIIGTFFINLPFGYTTIGHIPIILCIAYYILIGACIYAIYSPRNEFHKKRSKAKVLLCGSIINIFVIVIVMNITKNDLEINMLDVGQGDSFFVSSNKSNFLIDGGGVFAKDDGENVGVTVLKPFLSYKGIDNIDCVFITHSDKDHAFGVYELMEYIKIDTLYLSSKDTGTFKAEIEKRANKYNIPIVYLKEGDKVKINNCILTVLNPNENIEYEDNNDNSLVLKLEYNEFSTLFTGDITKETEERLLINHNNINSNIFKLSHHGSKFANTEEFIKKVNPTFAIVSTGIDNRFNHPDKEIVKRLEFLNIPLYNTSEKGAVKISLKNNKIKVSEMIK